MTKEQFKSDIKRIKEASINNRLVIFVGAGVSQNSGLPGWEQLISELKYELPKSVEYESDYLKIAQLYYNSREKKEYLDKIRSIFKVGSYSKNPIHDLIFDLKPCHVVTTNYDDLLEQTIFERNLQYYIIKKDCNLPYSTYDRFLIKMHGDLDEGNIILTEEDYYNYTNTFPLIETFVKSLFASKLILFIGFSFNDLNLKIITHRVKSLLRDDFQPMYLLNLNNETIDVYYEYYKKQGVRIVNYNEVIDKDTTLGSRHELNIIVNNLGKKLFKFLYYINHFDDLKEKERDKDWNIIDVIYKVYLDLKDEINVVNFKYLFRIYPFSKINEDGGFIIDLVKDLRASLKESIQNKREFLNKYGKKYEDLCLMAYRNGIYFIDQSDQIYSKSKFRKNNPKLEPFIYKFFEFDLNAINKRIEILSSRPLLDISIEDLELPYLLFKTERYFDAYTKLKELGKISWGKKKYIIYLICALNIKSLKNKLFFTWAGSNLPRDIINNLIKEIDEIDIHHIIETIQIKHLPIREFFKDIIDNTYILNLLVEENNLKDEILDSKRLADNHGFSFNSFVSSLSSNIWDNWNVVNGNFLFLDDYNYYTNAYQKAFESFLISHSTKGRSTKLKQLKRFHILIGVFYLETKELRGFLQKNDIRSISISIDSEEYLKKISGNFIKVLEFSIENQSPIIEQYKTSFKNILLILRKIEGCKEILKNMVNQLIHFILTKENHIDNIIFEALGNIYLTDLIESRYLELALFHTVQFYYGKGSLEFTQKLVFSLQEHNPNYKIHNREVVKSLIVLSFQSEMLLRYLVYFFPILANADLLNIKKNVEKYLLEKYSSSLYFLFLNNDIFIDNENLHNRLLNEYELYLDKNDKEIHHFMEASIFYNYNSMTYALYQIYKNSNHTLIKENISAKSFRSPFLKFLIDPMSFNEYSLFSTSWLTYLDHNFLKKISGKQDLKQIIQKEIKEINNNHKLIDIYFRYFN